MQPIALSITTESMADSPLSLTLTTDDARYEAIRRRDKRADAAFVYAVASTGVYCRPSCGARLALRKNVSFYDSPAKAERAGYRACKRCRPQEQGDARLERIVASVRAQLESDDAPKTLAALASHVGMSPFHLQRVFKQHVGMTPRAYAAAHRLQRVDAELRRGRSVTSALYEAGYSSSSRFYEAASGALGVRPRALRQGAALRLRVSITDCSLGHMLVAASERGVCAISFGDSKRALRETLKERFPGATLEAADPALEQLSARIAGMVDQARFAEDVPLDLIGTAFQQKVWRALQTIPRGETRSYKQIAEQVGAPNAVRAVGTACGDNPVAPLVPCHRVLRSDGALGGYRWGLARKQKLLSREQKA